MEEQGTLALLRLAGLFGCLMIFLVIFVFVGLTLVLVLQDRRRDEHTRSEHDEQF